MKLHRFCWWLIFSALITACGGGGSGGGGSTTVPDESSPPSSAPTLAIANLNLAQTHVIPAEGKRWQAGSIGQQELHMVGNRAAVALLDLSPSNVDDVMIEGQIDGVSRGLVQLQPNENLPPSEADGPRYSDSAAFANLPSAWMQPGLELRATAPAAQSSPWQAVNVGAPTDLEIRNLPLFAFGATESDVSNDPSRPSATQQEEIQSKLPVGTTSAVNHPAGAARWDQLVIAPRNGNPAYVMSSADDALEGFDPISSAYTLASRLRIADGQRELASQYYVALLMRRADGGFASAGGGLGGGHNATGDHVYRGIFIHELGHAAGLPHAIDSFDDGVYPYPGGSLNGSEWGFDQARNQFMPTIVPSTASRFADCGNNNFGGTPRQLDDENRCIRQDPMQSGSGDQHAGDSYTLFADFSAARIQRYLEGLTTQESDGTHSYSGGRVHKSDASSTGYRRWDSLDLDWVEVDPTDDPENGRFGVNRGYPAATNVPVYTIVFTISNANTPGATQIYPVLGPYSGNLVRNFDPMSETDREEITPNTGRYPWYCRQSGCDYSLRLTYVGGVSHVVVKGGFRPFFDQEGTDPRASDPIDGQSFETFVINVPASTTLTRVELLSTPTVWNGVPILPNVLATRAIN